MFKYVMLIIFTFSGLCSADLPVGYQYLFPQPNAKNVAVESQIIIRLQSDEPYDLRSLDNFIQIIGAKSGRIAGAVKIASDDQTIIFTPDSNFQYDDEFTVSINLSNTLQEPSPFSFQFKTIAKQDVFNNFQKDEAESKSSRMSGLQKPMETARIMSNGVSVPSDFPHINVVTNKQTADGYIFINNWRDERPYNIIFENDGSPVWYQRQVDGDRRRDFKVQKNGTISMLTRRGGQRFLGYDKNFNRIDEYSASAGYGTDEHECQVLENGNYLLFGVRSISVDMSYLGGSRSANVSETTIQEYTSDHELIFNWPALEHLDPADMIGWCDPGQADPTSSSFRFPHMNAIDIDEDGNILLSSRHLSEVTKIDRQTGEIIWRLGGANSDFTFVNDDLDGFRMQHDVRSLGNNHYTVFDNGNIHNPSQSRAVEYVLDLDKKTATLVWEFRGPEGRNFYTHYMGNNQRLPNGNVFINWVTSGNPKAMEVTPDGQVVYEMNWVDRYDTYRTFRFPWDGVVQQPSLYVEQDNNSLVLIFNKFGDGNVDYYKIYADVQPGPMTVVDTSKATLKKITGLVNDQRYYFRVTAVSTSGEESAFSNEENVLVNFVNAGQNIVRNGDFSAGDDNWNFVTNGATASRQVTGDGEMRITIETPGADFNDIQLYQSGQSLVRGETYLFEFDAYSTANRTIEALVEKNGKPWTNYGKLNPTALRRGKQHFAYEFLMENASDFNARVVFNCGMMAGDVYIDNVSLTNIEGDIPFSELSEPWKNQDIGGPALAGNASGWQDRYTVQGSGSDIWGNSDEFHFAYVPFVGDGEISARVVSLTETNGWAKAGVMLRNSLQPGSVHAFTCATVQNGIAFQRRVENNQASLSSSVGERHTPHWVKLERTGNTFTSYESPDGKNWNEIGSEEIAMNETIYAGFAVTSHDNKQLCQAVFDDLHISSQTDVHEIDINQPDSFALYPAYPNPFNPRTIIKYSLPELAKVKLVVYNVRGEQIRELIDCRQPAGNYEVEFDASELSSGVYLYKLAAAPQSGAAFLAIHKMTIIK